jgi:hypothetical protein
MQRHVSEVDAHDVEIHVNAYIGYVFLESIGESVNINVPSLVNNAESGYERALETIG